MQGVFFLDAEIVHVLGGVVELAPLEDQTQIVAVHVVPVFDTALLHLVVDNGLHDLEGVGASMGFWKALSLGPSNFVALRLEAWRAASARDRRFIAVENVACGVLPLLAICDRVSIEIIHL